ncbi:MAG: DUF2948 family protein, partial [Alphaproteobacteria bacterium]|nr:DUF2948 family protein [Alphaproteobacteria bacterium]
MAANGPPNDQALKLSARDEADLDVLSSLLQDAAVPVADMAYFPEQRRFALVASRFRWEQDGRRAAEAAGSRITCGLRVEGVRRAALHGIDRKHPDEV